MTLAAGAAMRSRWLQGNFTGDVLKAPFNVRTETARNNTGNLVTASAGFLQNLVYGFTGLRIEDKGLVAAYPPMLPPSWNSLTLKRIAFRGAHSDIHLERRLDRGVVLRRSASRD